jgi:hypothetical protein
MYHHMNGQAAEATLQLQSVSGKGTERMTSGLRIAAQGDSKASFALLLLEARQQMRKPRRQAAWHVCYNAQQREQGRQGYA